MTQLAEQQRSNETSVKTSEPGIGSDPALQRESDLADLNALQLASATRADIQKNLAGNLEADRPAGPVDSYDLRQELSRHGLEGKEVDGLIQHTNHFGPSMPFGERRVGQEPESKQDTKTQEPEAKQEAQEKKADTVKPGAHTTENEPTESQEQDLAAKASISYLSPDKERGADLSITGLHLGRLGRAASEIAATSFNFEDHQANLAATAANLENIGAGNGLPVRDELAEYRNSLELRLAEGTFYESTIDPRIAALRERIEQAAA